MQSLGMRFFLSFISLGATFANARPCAHPCWHKYNHGRCLLFFNIFSIISLTFSFEISTRIALSTFYHTIRASFLEFLSANFPDFLWFNLVLLGFSLRLEILDFLYVSQCSSVNSWLEWMERNDFRNRVCFWRLKEQEITSHHASFQKAC